MHPKVSKAEIEVFKSLSINGLTNGMVTQRTIVLKSTVPDFCWLNKRKAVYLDGKHVHSSDKQKERDEEMVELLEEKGWRVLRILYDPPISKKVLKETVEKIRSFINSDE
jgi:very-short-patch-repair endonuclease